MARRKVPGTTSGGGGKPVGKTTTTRKAAHVVADQISRPHGPGTVRKVGPQTHKEAQDLSGDNGARSGSVRQIGPSAIRPANSPTGKVTRAGAANFEDTIVVEGISRPYSRQSGSVKQVGPASRAYTRLTEGSGSAGQPKTGRVSRTRVLITETPLLKSGVGRKHPWAVFAGQPGTRKGNSAVRVAGAAGNNVLVNGRKARFGPEPLPSAQTTPTGKSIVPGS